MPNKNAVAGCDNCGGNRQSGNRGYLMRGGPFLPKFNHKSERGNGRLSHIVRERLRIGAGTGPEQATGAKLYQGRNFHGVIAGVVPAISIGMAGT